MIVNMIALTFIFDDIQKKYNNDPEMIAEWCYSLKQATLNYQNEPHVKQFADILNGVNSEEIYYREMEVIKNVMVSLEEMDNGKTGRINILERSLLAHS